jgi:hypothetical protein
MQRRELLKGMTAAAIGVCLNPRTPKAWAQEPMQQVKTVYVIYKCHLDVGFTDTEQGVIRTYFDDYLLRAMDTAQELRESAGEERYVWTIAAWMLYHYLEQASTDKRQRMEQAIGAGDIAWHAMPFTWNSEMLDRSLIASALGLSAAMDKRFGKKTIAGKLTDVPCHTRGLVGPLAEAGIRFLDIGDNAGCKAPDVPFIQVPGTAPGQPLSQKLRLEDDSHAYLFNWRDPEGAEVMVLYHPFDYGGTLAIPGA